MSVRLNGLGNHFQGAITGLANSSWTMLCWCKVDAAVSIPRAMSVAETAFVNYRGTRFDDGTGGRGLFQSFDGNFRIAQVTGVDVDNRWSMIAGTVDASNNIRCFLENQSSGPVTSVAVANNILQIGRQLDSGGYTGYIAECAIWNVVLTDQMIADQWTQGLRPDEVMPGDLFYYCSYRSNATSQVGPTLPTFGTPVFDENDHPPVTPVSGPFLKRGLTTGGALKPSLLK